VKRVEVTIIASNCEAFPSGSRAWARELAGQLTELAVYRAEDITYSLTGGRVKVATELGYQFTISTADYNQLLSG
jgi:hypothetical protein